MILEEQKREIQKLINETGKLFTNKRNELDHLRIHEEDKISVFMKEGEVPETFNDSKLMARYNKLNYYSSKLDDIKTATTQAILLNNVSGNIYLRDLKSKLDVLELDIQNV